MLSSAYSDGVTSDERSALMLVLSEAGMSNRSVATAISAVSGESYSALTYEVSLVVYERGHVQRAKDRVRERLERHGYSAWRAEVD